MLEKQTKTNPKTVEISNKRRLEEYEQVYELNVDRSEYWTN